MPLNPSNTDSLLPPDSQRTERRSERSKPLNSEPLGSRIFFRFLELYIVFRVLNMAN